MDQANFFQTSPLGQAGTSSPVPPAFTAQAILGTTSKTATVNPSASNPEQSKVILSPSCHQGFTQARGTELEEPQASLEMAGKVWMALPKFLVIKQQFHDVRL